MNTPEKPLLGLEFEVPFSFYFPEVFNKHLGELKSWNRFNGTMSAEFNSNFQEVEEAMLKRLAAATEFLGLKRGADRYWEFVFPASASWEEHLDKVNKLIEIGLMPKSRRLPLHLTLSQDDMDRDKAFSILLFLELEYLTPERALAGFHSDYTKRTWNRKGKAGIKIKEPYQLEHAEEAFELRTLSVHPGDMSNVLLMLDSLVSDKHIVEEAKHITEKMGLPWKQWTEEEFKIFSQFLKAR